jgi:hypothetical protein
MDGAAGLKGDPAASAKRRLLQREELPNLTN